MKIVGVQDNFFHIGGHSLLLTRLVSEMRHTFEIEISIRTLFGHPILADMALLIEESKRRIRKVGEIVTLKPQVQVVKGFHYHLHNNDFGSWISW